ncbi:MAG TPA: hypothetical protein VME18_01980 [Acidobacteriaceae bacterium]|nr:hypothetical protein [Acidobacteriaceae bacterium]
MLFRYFPRKRAWAGIAILAAAAVCVAQPVHPHATRSHSHRAYARAGKTPAPSAVDSTATGAAPPQPQKPLPLQEQPPQPATITLSGGKLAVRADNSSLIQILDQLGKSGGMSISGLSQDQRVFGVYGPGDPSEILSELLEGAGYNVLMTGITPEGTPRELVLSVQSGAPPSPPQSFPQPNDGYVQPFYQRQPIPPAPPRGNLDFPVRSPAQMYQQMMQEREQQRQQQPQPQ